METERIVEKPSDSGDARAVDMVFVGVDPGLSGAIAWCYGTRDNGQLYISEMNVVDIPCYKGDAGQKARIDMIAVRALFNSPPLLSPIAQRNRVCCIEKAMPSPLMPVVSCFTYGEGYGAMRTALTYFSGKIPLEVSPQAWKRFFFRGERFESKKESKKAALDRAKSFYPMIDFGKRADAGRAEAVLLCRYAVRTLERTIEPDNPYKAR